MHKLVVSFIGIPMFDANISQCTECNRMQVK